MPVSRSQSPRNHLASAAKNVPLMAVMVRDDGINIFEYDVKEGQSIEFRVGGTMKAFMQRVGPAPNGDMYIDATAGNKQPVVIDFEHALSGPQHFRAGSWAASHSESGSRSPVGNERAENGSPQPANVCDATAGKMAW